MGGLPYDLLTRHEHLLRLERTVQEQHIELLVKQIHLRERCSPGFQELHIENCYTGDRVAVVFWSSFKGAGVPTIGDRQP